jgi:hypothetical protein
MPRFEPTVSEAHKLLSETLIAAASGRLSLDAACLAPTIKIALDLITQALQKGVPEAELHHLFKEFVDPEVDEVIEQRLRDHFSSLNPNVARVLCLTSSFNNDVMWGTYAESHYGCVLGFTAAALDSPFHEAKPVAYTDRPAIAGSGLDFFLYGDSSELRKNTLKAVCYTKNLVWSYEQEWRLITWRPLEVAVTHGDYIFYPEELESVTFGARARPEFIKSICEITSRHYPHLTLFQMNHRRGELCRILVE